MPLKSTFPTRFVTNRRKSAEKPTATGNKRLRVDDDENEQPAKKTRSASRGSEQGSVASTVVEVIERHGKQPGPTRTPPPKPPGPGDRSPGGTPLTRHTVTPSRVREQRRTVEKRLDAQDKKHQEELRSVQYTNKVKASIETLKAELVASGLIPNERRDRDKQVVLSAKHVENLIFDNDQLRRQLNAQLKDGPSLPLVMTEQQKAQMSNNLRALKTAHEDILAKAQKEGRTYVFPSLMSQANTRVLPKDEAKACLEDLVDRVRRIVWENMDVDQARAGMTSNPKTEHSLSGLWFCVDDARPYLQSDGRPELVFLLLEAFIWYRLQRYIFNAPAMDWNDRPYWARPLPGPSVPIAWGVGVGPALFTYFAEVKGAVKREFPEMLPQLHQLRAKLATFLDRMHGDPQSEVQVAAINAVFGQQLIGFVREERITLYLRAALGIIDQAMKLDTFMRRCLADWEVRPSRRTRKLLREKPLGQWEFSHKDMVVAGLHEDAEEPNASDGRSVSLVVSPGLVRSGNETGKGYTDPTETVVKCRVVLNPDDFQQEYVPQEEEEEEEEEPEEEEEEEEQQQQEDDKEEEEEDDEDDEEEEDG